jgi:chaperonin GroEL (HSP60 family)
LRQLPIAIAENAGFDANELIHDLEIDLKTKADSGINVELGCIDSMEKLAITVLLHLFRNAIDPKSKLLFQRARLPK